ncbi:PilT protein domain-containing protein [Thauera linaloolentis 47Lol = DSM 12138]|uniref:PilT protein domain-containing protein n=1 Tax=Thauera linaloolentis (strain DSM 12138 / JCM 21573 / CCUG 41526 / CIP 105981 / IAM 15112 / NBRC 102519 / 47Lol) TaxID=1123367 RepID=N6Y867_THAL4|nr:PilT protein domain-containing protein [Thauera linaloolentis 47Lol = DSM 12138]
MVMNDSMIAAISLEHGFAFVTGNTRDFESSGVGLIDPWAYGP